MYSYLSVLIHIEMIFDRVTQTAAYGPQSRLPRCFWWLQQLPIRVNNLNTK